MTEAANREEALARVTASPRNHYHEILALLEADIRRNWKPGTTFVCADLFYRTMELSPDLRPEEKRVMGAVMRALRAEELIAPTGRVISTPKRSHVGDTKEWVVL